MSEYTAHNREFGNFAAIGAAFMVLFSGKMKGHL
jgi:hypothetical protein